MDQNDLALIKTLSDLSHDWEFAPALIEAIKAGSVSSIDKEKLASVLLKASLTANIAKKEVEMAIALEIAESSRRMEAEEADRSKIEILEKLEAL